MADDQPVYYCQGRFNLGCSNTVSVYGGLCGACSTKLDQQRKEAAKKKQEGDKSRGERNAEKYLGKKKRS